MFDTHSWHNFKTVINTISKTLLKTMIVNMLILSLWYADVKNNTNKITKQEIDRVYQEYVQMAEVEIATLKKRHNRYKKAVNNPKYANKKDKYNKQANHFLELIQEQENKISIIDTLPFDWKKELTQLLTILDKSWKADIDIKNDAVSFIGWLYSDKFDEKKVEKLYLNLQKIASNTNEWQNILNKILKNQERKTSNEARQAKERASQAKERASQAKIWADNLQDALKFRDKIK